jgi:hypothetical protein
LSAHCLRSQKWWLSKTSKCKNACINLFKSLKLEKDQGPAAGTKAGAQERYLFALSRNSFLWSKEGQVVQLHRQNQQINFQESNQLIPLKRGRTSRFTSLACHAIQAPKDPLRYCSPIWACMFMRPNNFNWWSASLSLLTAYFHESFKTAVIGISKYGFLPKHRFLNLQSFINSFILSVTTFDWYSYLLVLRQEALCTVVSTFTISLLKHVG